MSAADRIASSLGGGAAERESGYRQLEDLARAASTCGSGGGGVNDDVVELAVACVAPLCSVLCQGALDVGAEEYQRATTVLLGLAPLDIDRVGAEVIIPEKGHCMVATARDSVFGKVVDKRPTELTPEDALIYACQQAIMNLMWPRTWQVSHEIAGVAWDVILPAHIAASHLLVANNNQLGEDFNIALVTVIVGLLRSNAVPDVLLSGAIHSMVHATIGRPAVAAVLMELGIIDLSVAIMRQSSPQEWVSAASAVRPGYSGYFVFLMKEIIECTANAGADITAELLASGYIEIMISMMAALPQLGAAKKLNCSTLAFGLMGSMLGIGTLNSGACLQEIESLIKDSCHVKTAVKYLIDNNIVWCSVMKYTTGMFSTMLAASLWGREEDTEHWEFSQANIDSLLAHATELMYPGVCLGEESYGRNWQLSGTQCRNMLNICISDTGKQLLLNSTGGNGVVRHLTDGLLIDPENPRQEAPHHIKASVQRDFAECIQQLSLYPPGAEALKADETLIRAVAALATEQQDGGLALSADARECARNTLLTLDPSQRQRAEDSSRASGSDKAAQQADEGGGGGGGGGHVMISYQWKDQPIVKEIVAALQARHFKTWFDLENMKGSVIDAMSEAVEGADVVLFGISLAYKESANCRLEASYAVQNQSDMIPLMMQENYTAKGWLGLVLGARKWISFFSSAVSSAAKFESQIEELTREIGPRGRQLPPPSPPQQQQQQRQQQQPSQTRSAALLPEGVPVRSSGTSSVTDKQSRAERVSGWHRVYVL